MTTISSYFSINTPKSLPKITELRVTEAWGSIQQKHLTQQDLVGIEIEIENIPTLVDNCPSLYCWNNTTDGSLRNNGLEFVSKVMHAHQVPIALHELNAILPDKAVFSKRTSVHIHTDVTTLTFEQLKSFVLLYLIYEKALYNWVGHGRENNIFCVPTYKSHLYMKLFNLFTTPQYFGETWMKYTGFNLRAIAEKGTIEFRHLYGTNDSYVIQTWINFLLCLKQTALTMPAEQIQQQIIDLDKFSAYANLTAAIFGSARHILFNQLTFMEDMAHCVNMVKRQLFKEKAVALIKPTITVEKLQGLNTKILTDILYPELKGFTL